MNQDPKTTGGTSSHESQKSSLPSPSASSAPSPSVASVPSVVKESPEVSSAANRARKRQDALEEASKLLGVDVRNNIDGIVMGCAQSQPALIKHHWNLLQERVKRAGEALELAEQNS